MVVDYSRRSFKTALLVAVIAEVLCVVSIATPLWTEEYNCQIGLWTLKDLVQSKSYSWTSTGQYRGDFYYSTWMNAVRGMMMAGLIMGCFGILFNLYIVKKCKNQMNHGTTLMCYYFLSFTMVIVAVATYVCKIPQGVDQKGEYVSDTTKVAEYIYRGGYGYSLWFGWIGAGVFLPAAGLAYEGGNQQRVAERLARYKE